MDYSASITLDTEKQNELSEIRTATFEKGWVGSPSLCVSANERGSYSFGGVLLLLRQEVKVADRTEKSSQ